MLNCLILLVYVLPILNSFGYHRLMKPIDYYRMLSKAQRRIYAAKAGTTLNYLVAHVFRESSPMRRPSNRLLVGLVKASDGNISIDEAIDYFLVQPVKKLVNELDQSSQVINGNAQVSNLKEDFFDGE